jgi:hypothetical protein
MRQSQKSNYYVTNDVPEYYFTQRSERRRNVRKVGTRGVRGVIFSLRTWREIITIKEGISDATAELFIVIQHY